MSQPRSSGRPRPHANTTPHTPQCEEPHYPAGNKKVAPARMSGGHSAHDTETAGPRARTGSRGPAVTCGGGSVLAFVLLEALVGAANLGLRFFAADPVRALDALAGLEVLVDLEEVLDFQAVEL